MICNSCCILLVFFNLKKKVISNVSDHVSAITSHTPNKPWFTSGDDVGV
jgi:hypothetical protein